MRTIIYYAFVALISVYVFYHLVGVIACYTWEYL
jgi:hypothetical protein